MRKPVPRLLYTAGVLMALMAAAPSNAQARVDGDSNSAARSSILLKLLAATQKRESHAL